MTPDRITARVAAIGAVADIAAALRELSYIRDHADVVANVRQRLEAARVEIDTAVLFIDGAIEAPATP
jgi:hypothetical protein